MKDRLLGYLFVSILISVVVGLQSCREDVDDTTVVTTFPDPVRLEVSALSGQILEENGTPSQWTEVTVLTPEEPAVSTNADGVGSFNFSSALTRESYAFVKAEGYGYLPQFRGFFTSGAQRGYTTIRMTSWSDDLRYPAIEDITEENEHLAIEIPGNNYLKDGMPYTREVAVDLHRLESDSLGGTNLPGPPTTSPQLVASGYIAQSEVFYVGVRESYSYPLTFDTTGGQVFSVQFKNSEPTQLFQLNPELGKWDKVEAVSPGKFDLNAFGYLVLGEEVPAKEIRGSVIDENGAPVVNELVSLSAGIRNNLGGYEIHQHTNTDASGRFKLLHHANDEVTLSVGAAQRCGIVSTILSTASGDVNAGQLVFELGESKDVYGCVVACDGELLGVPSTIWYTDNNGRTQLDADPLGHFRFTSSACVEGPITIEVQQQPGVGELTSTVYQAGDVVSNLEIQLCESNADYYHAKIDFDIDGSSTSFVIDTAVATLSGQEYTLVARDITRNYALVMEGYSYGVSYGTIKLTLTTPNVILTKAVETDWPEMWRSERALGGIFTGVVAARDASSNAPLPNATLSLDVSAELN